MDDVVDADLDERGSVAVEAALAVLALFVVVVPVLAQLFTVVLVDLVGVAASQAAADQLAKNDVDRGAAVIRAEKIAAALGGPLVEELQIRIVVDRDIARAEVDVHPYRFVPTSIRLTRISTAPVEMFRPDLAGAP